LVSGLFLFKNFGLLIAQIAQSTGSQRPQGFLGAFAKQFIRFANARWNLIARKVSGLIFQAMN